MQTYYAVIKDAQNYEACGNNDIVFDNWEFFTDYASGLIRSVFSVIAELI